MAWFDEKQLVDILTIASILSAAAFGALGLFTDFKKDGKVTRYGRLAVGGIMLSAAFSIVVGLLQDRIEANRSRQAAEKEAADRAAEVGRFTDQINRLEGLNRAATELQQGMRNSLRAQDMIIAGARQSMLLTASLGAQEHRNTGRVIRTMWTDANRIGRSSIEVIASYTCSMRQGAVLPPLLRDGARLTLGLRPRSYLGPRGSLDAELPFTRQRFPPTALRGILLLGEYGAIRLSADPHDFHAANRRDYDGENFSFSTSHSIRFGPFLQGDLGQFTNPEGWVGASAEIVISAPLLMGGEQFAALFSAEMGGQDEVIARFPGSSRSWGIGVLPCSSHLTLLVNGRVFAEPPSAMILLPTQEDGRPPTIVLKSHIVLIDSAALPRLSD